MENAAGLDAAGVVIAIKGNEGSMKYHTEDSPWCGRTKAEVWFATPEAAKAAGFVNAVKESASSDEEAAK